MDEELPLAGLSVVDLTSNIAAPWAAAVLADLGADVVHVEPPGGDDARRMAPAAGDGSAYFHVVNRNKTGVRLDLRTQSGRAALDALLADADVFVCNLRPAKLVRYGLDAEALSDRFPRLVHATLSGYGDGGVDRDRAGYDAVLQARTGVAGVTGAADGPPVRAGVSVLDVGAGTWLALGVLAALLRRERTGRGGAVATSLFETGATWVSYHVVAHQLTGAESGRFGSGHPAFSPYGIFAAADGNVCIGVGGDAGFAALCTALRAPELLSDARYASTTDRVVHDAELRADLERILGALPAAEVVSRLTAHGVPADRVQLPEDLLADPQAAALRVLQGLEVAPGREVLVPGLPLTLDGARPGVRRSAPGLGESVPRE